MVWVYYYTILLAYLNRLVHKDFSHTRSSSGSSTRSKSATAEPSKHTEHGAIQKGSVQCTVGAVSISYLLFAIFYKGNCDQPEEIIFTALRCPEGNSESPSLLQFHAKSISLLLED